MWKLIGGYGISLVIIAVCVASGAGLAWWTTADAPEQNNPLSQSFSAVEESITAVSATETGQLTEGAKATTDGLIEFDNGFMAIEIDPKTGRVTAINDLTKTSPLKLIEQSGETLITSPPFVAKVFSQGRIQNLEPSYPPHIDYCEPATLPCRKIRWWCGEEVVFEATVALVPGQAKVQFWASAKAYHDTPIYSLTYPVLANLAPLSANQKNDSLAIPYEGGMLLSNPLRRVREEIIQPNPILRDLSYPQGHSAMMQMVSYQSLGRGGFLIQAKDPSYTVKSFQFNDATPRRWRPSVVFSIEHMNWDLYDAAGNGGMTLDYPVEIAALKTGSWYEAAGIYREWAEQQLWAQRPIAERPEEERRVFETAAASVFGLSARENQTEWYRRFHELLCEGIDQARVLFVPGWDFHPNGEMAGEELNAFYQAGWDEQFWLPFQGSFVDNYLMMKGEHDDLVYPFLFDLLVHDQFPGWEGFYQPASAGDPDQLTWAELRLFDLYGKPNGFVETMAGFSGSTYTLNPANRQVRDFHQWRHQVITQSEQAGIQMPMDGVYHDISASLIGLKSYGLNSDEPFQGAGRWLVDEAREMYGASLRPENVYGRSFGMENVSEPFIDQVDFYHLGAEGLGPIRPRNPESNPEQAFFQGVNQWVMSRLAEHIPLVAFVYHPYGAMRTGGKVQISREMGDIFYWIAASEYAWGGILELIYFNAPADLLPGIDPEQVDCPGGYPCAFMTGWDSGPYGRRGWYYDDLREADPAKLEFLRQAAYLRLVAAKDYLTSGRMLAPPLVRTDKPLAEYDYDFYSHIRGDDYNHSGVFTAPSVIASAWETWDRTRKAFVLANSSDAERSVSLSFIPAMYGLSQPSPTLVIVDEQGARPRVPLGQCRLGRPCKVKAFLPARSFALIELPE